MDNKKVLAMQTEAYINTVLAVFAPMKEQLTDMITNERWNINTLDRVRIKTLMDFIDTLTKTLEQGNIPSDFGISIKSLEGRFYRLAATIKAREEKKLT